MGHKADGQQAFSLPSLRPGFALGWFAAAAVPLVVALLVVWQLALADAKREAEQRAADLHGLLADGMRTTVARLADKADLLAGEPAIVALADSDKAGQSALLATHPDQRQEMQVLFAEMLSERLPVRGVCVTSASSGLAVCSDPSALHASGSSAGGFPRLEGHTDGLEQSLRFVKPLPSADGPSAALVFLLDERSLLTPNKLAPLRQHVLLDAAGNPAGGNWDGPLPAVKPGDQATDTSGTVSVLPVMMQGEIWTSVTRWDLYEPADFQRHLLIGAVVSGMLLVLFAAGTTIVFHFVVSRPLFALRKLMKRAESGDLKAYWTMSATGEIGQLGDSYNQMLNRLEDLIKQVKVEEALKKEKEIEALHYQLNPHFLYNTLNTIKWVAKIHKTPQIADAVSALVRLLQASLGKKGDFLPLREELMLVRDYMAIQHFRYGDGIELVTDVEPVTDMCLVPKLILQPLVENAIIHGLHEKEGDRTITIRTRLDRDLLVIQVEDNGIGMEDLPADGQPGGLRPEAMERMSGIGLRHIREKLRLYYGPDYPMRIFSKPGEGTRVRLALPIHRE